MNQQRFVECVSFMLVRDGQVLVERRKLTKPVDPGAIAIPGGHMENGESQEETLVREMQEELAVVPLEYGYICSLLHKDSNQEVEQIHYFAVEAWQGAIENHEAAELLWIPLHEPATIDLNADRVAVSEYLRLFQ